LREILPQDALEVVPREGVARIEFAAVRRASATVAPLRKHRVIHVGVPEHAFRRDIRMPAADVLDELPERVDLGLWKRVHPVAVVYELDPDGPLVPSDRVRGGQHLGDAGGHRSQAVDHVVNADQGQLGEPARPGRCIAVNLLEEARAVTAVRPAE
jgi:hypothetical protein